MYTTNSVELLNRSLRQISKTRGGFHNEEAALKLLFLALRQAAKRWTMPIHQWREALNHFTILWPERMPGLGRGRHESAESFYIAGARGRDVAPSLALPSQKQNLVVYTEGLTHLGSAPFGCNLFRFFANLLPSTLSRQGLFDAALCAGLEVEGVALHFLNDVFRLNLALEATESVFY